MSLETTIASLVAAGNRLLALPEALAAQSTADRAAMAADFAARQASLSLSLHVNQATGNDASAGSAAAPLRSITAAIAKCPRGGALRILLQAPYMLSRVSDGSQTVIDARQVTITSSTATRHALDFERYEAGGYRYAARFVIVSGGAIVCNGIRVNQPSAVGFEAFPPSNAAAVFGAADGNPSGQTGLNSVIFEYCDMDFPVTPYYFLISSRSLLFDFVGLTMVGAVSSPLGRFVHQGSTSGVAASSIPEIVTRISPL